MAEILDKKESQSFLRRVLYPAGLALIAWVLLHVMASHLEWLGSGQICRTAAAILYPLLGITIVLSSVLVYSVMYTRGASATERILWSCIVPVVWILKEIWRVSVFFSASESFYYALSPSPLGLLFSQIGFLCLGEIFWRWRDKKSGKAIRIFTAGPVAGLVFWLVTVYFMLLWGSSGDTPGSKWFYLYMEGYKALFVN
jgi:hypothetical protein